MNEVGAIAETGGVAAAVPQAPVLSGRGTPIGGCADCGEPLTGAFCAGCGQPRDVHRRSLRHLLVDLISDLASFDSRILRTTRALMFLPGELPRAFHDGRTQRYVPAVRLYFFVSLFFFVFLSLTGVALVQLEMTATPLAVQIDAQGHPYRIGGDGETIALPQRFADGKPHDAINPHVSFFSRLGSEHSRLTPQQVSDLDARMQRATDKVVKKGAWWAAGLAATMHRLTTDPGALNGNITIWMPRALFVILPLFAVLLQLFYWPLRDFYFVDHLVFSLSFHSFGFALLAAAATAAQFVAAGLVGTAMGAALLLYLLVALRRMYRQSWLATGMKFAVISFVYVFFFLAPAFITVMALAIFGIDGNAG